MKESKKLKEVYYKRMPNELKEKLNTLDADTQNTIFTALDSYHSLIEDKTYELALKLIKALAKSATAEG